MALAGALNMTRLEIEKEIMQVMSLLDPTTGDILADANTRLYVQSRIASAVDRIVGENKWNFRRKSFAVFLKAPVTNGTITFTQGAKIGVVSVAAPDSTWIGGHVIISGNGFPLAVESVSGSSVTFVEPIMIASAVGMSFQMYFDGGLVPSDCAHIKDDTVKISGHRRLDHLPRESFENYVGYYGETSDYGKHFDSGYYNSVISQPQFGQPLVYTSWRSLLVSNSMRRVLNVYPYPDQNYSLGWDGWRKTTALSVTGTSDGDTSVPDLPEDHHRTLLVPAAKLEMGEYPGWELASSEKETVQALFTSGLRNLYNENAGDENENHPFRTNGMC